MRFILPFVAAAACLVACSSEGAGEVEGSLPEDGVKAEASATTRQEIGVAYWVLEQGGAGDLNGYTEDFDVRVTFRHQEQSRDGATLHAFTFSDADGSARVVMMRETASSEFTVLESTLEGHYQRIGELMASDLRTMPHAAAAAASSPSLTTSARATSLKPLAPVDCQGSELCLTRLDHCRLINDKCVGAIGNYKDAQPAAAAYCPIYKDANKLTDYCRIEVKKGSYGTDPSSAFSACVGAVTNECKQADYASRTAGDEAKKCTANQEVQDCRVDLGYAPLAPIK